MPPKTKGRGQLVWGGEFDRPGADSLLAEAKWIWHPTGNPSVSYPLGGVFFRCGLESSNRSRLVAARLVLTADNTYEVKFNGRKIGNGDDFRIRTELDLTEYLAKEGGNELIVRADNMEAPGPVGLLAAFELTFADGARELITSGSGWQALRADGADDWPDSRTAGWVTAMNLGSSQMAPWKLALRRERELYPSYRDVAALLEGSGLIAVGTAVAGGPPRRSVREELPHTALALSRARKRCSG